MAWNKNTGGRPSQNDNRGPWSNPQPSGGGGGGRGDKPPDLDDILQRGQERLRRMFSHGGGSAAFLILAVLGLIWLASGVYQVGPAQNGVVQRFGKYVALKNPGLQWHIPWPVETAQPIDVRGVQKTYVPDDQGHPSRTRTRASCSRAIATS